MNPLLESMGHISDWERSIHRKAAGSCEADSCGGDFSHTRPATQKHTKTGKTMGRQPCDIHVSCQPRTIFSGEKQMSKYDVGFIVMLFAGMLLVACQAPSVEPVVHVAPIIPPSVQADHPADLPGLHNVVAYTADTFSGAVPEGEEGFATLKGMGIKTVISVDGAKPDLAAAGKYGLRYVHLPIGYDGVPTDRQLELARALRDLDGPIYIHCHHGKHRSAAATGAACATLGRMTSEDAVNRMKVSGTSPKYKGLYGDVTAAHTVNDAQLDQASNAFPQTWQTTGIVDAMVAIDVATEHLKDIQKAGWKVPADHPDLVPAAEAGRLADLLRNFKDNADVKKQPQELTDWMLDSAKDVSKLEEMIVAGNSEPALLDAQFKVIRNACNDCHVKYRN
jgi:protein tyrosine phosphatase (PTP) superfamily phosphohydrolase (DUF442 family)